MSVNQRELRRQLESVDLTAGLTRDQLREQFPNLPDDVYLYLPASKKFYTADDVLGQTGEHALARAEGEGVGPEFDLPVQGAVEDDGPPAYGHSLSPGEDYVEGAGDYPGAEDDIGGNSVQTSGGRGL